MPRRETLNNHNTAKIMAETFGHSNIFATLSLSLSLSLSQVPTYNNTSFIYRPRGRVNIRLFLEKSKGSRIVF